MSDKNINFDRTDFIVMVSIIDHQGEGYSYLDRGANYKNPHRNLDAANYMGNLVKDAMKTSNESNQLAEIKGVTFKQNFTTLKLSPIEQCFKNNN